MKPLISLFQIIIIIVMLPALTVFAQQNTRVLLPLNEEDFECFQTIECIIESESIKEKGWGFVMDESVDAMTKEYTISMKGTNVSLSANYNKNGELSRATYKRVNLALPDELVSYFNSNEFEGWLVTSTEMVLKNFDQRTLSYTVELQNSNSSETLRFTHSDILEMRENVKKLADN